MTTGPRVRFAPSPTGSLHLGSARSALFNWLYARHTGGTLVLRIEDTDLDRSSEDMVESILRTFEWLGIDFDEGPYRQSERTSLYLDAAADLRARGLAYYVEGDVDDPTTFRDAGLDPGPGRVLRFRAPDEGQTVVHDEILGDVAFPNADIEDFVILRSNGSPVFLLANAVDDPDMAITHAIRGQDLLNTTPKVLLLIEALGRGPAPRYAHVPLIVNEQGKKLSKRRDDVAVEDYRDRGFLPQAMVNYLALLGWGPRDDVEVRPVAEIIEQFDIADIAKNPARFDPVKLASVNGDHVRLLSDAEVATLTVPWARRADWYDESTFDADRWLAAVPLFKERLTTLADAPGVVDFLFRCDPVVDPAAWTKVMVDGPQAAGMLDDVLGAAGDVPWEAAALHPWLKDLGEARGLKLGKAQAPVRVAVTGRTVGPPLFESLELLGRDETVRRLTVARAALG